MLFLGISSEIDLEYIVVKNLEESKDFEKEVNEIIERNKEIILSIIDDLFTEPIEIFLVKDLKKFVEKEFIDIEKLRILARYLIIEKFPTIHAIPILDKIILEKGDNTRGSIIHSILHVTMYILLDPFHYVDNYMELKFHRESVVESLVHQLERRAIESALKLTERTYLYLLSALKHYSAYSYILKKGLRKIVEEDINTLEKWCLQREKEESVELDEKIKLTTIKAVFDRLGFQFNLQKSFYLDYVARQTNEILNTKLKLRSYRGPNEVLKRAISIVLEELSKQ